jgi:signal transduction histidine kinase
LFPLLDASLSSNTGAALRFLDQVHMTAGQNISLKNTGLASSLRSLPLPGLYLTCGVAALTLTAALVLPKGYPLAWIGDSVQTVLQAAAIVLAFQNARNTRSQFRLFWLLVLLGMLMWLISQLIWCAYELWYRIPMADTPVGDTLLFIKLVPLLAAAALEPDKTQDSPFRAFGLLDLAILIITSLYLFAFYVYAYRLLPGATQLYDYHFNVAHTIGNQLFALVTGLAFFRASGSWRRVLGVFFFSAVCYAIGSDFSNSAIDLGAYYTGSLYDVPLNASMAAIVWLCLAGRSFPPPAPSGETSRMPQPRSLGRFTFLSSHLALFVTISIPAIGLWLVASDSASSILFSFRLHVTLITIFLLTLLLSIKQDILSANLLGSLRHLSATYSSINRFKGHLLQSEKLTTLGELVATASRQISGAMTQIQEQASGIILRSPAESRPAALAAKISQYALRTDALAESLQRFAQESPLELAPVDVKSLLESALHLSRIAKLPHLRVELREDAPAPPVLADSSQLLHVFLQILSNAMDALQEVGGGELLISIHPCDPQVAIQFADTGPGLSHPEHVFEPFFTTKPIGKGTGLGLSTCYGIIRQHNGDISCGNRLEGGAHFTIFLPAVSQQLPQSAESSAVLESRR